MSEYTKSDLKRLRSRESPRTKSEFTKTERRIVEYLRAHPGKWFRDTEIISGALGTHHKPNTPLVRVHIHFIRKKLGDESTKLESCPSRKRGYRWVGEEHE